MIKLPNKTGNYFRFKIKNILTNSVTLSNYFNLKAHFLEKKSFELIKEYKSEVKVFSNPTSNSVSISIEVDEGPVPVKIKFFNTNFTEVKMSNYGVLLPGTHTVSENISMLPPGMYYIGAYFNDLPVGQFHLLQIIP